MTRRVRSSNNGHTERNLAASSARLSMLRQHNNDQAQDATFIYLRRLTLDNNDWVFAAAYRRAIKENDAALAERIEDAYIPYMESIAAFFERRSVEVLGRECPQVLLIHASKLNAKMLPTLLQMFRERGYTFVSLEQAMNDKCYRTPDTYVGRKGLSWIHRWGLARGKPIEPEPEEPVWVDKLSSQPLK